MAQVHDGGRLVGFVGAYRFGAGDPEIAGAVDPAARRRGVGSALVAAVRRDVPGAALLVVPRTTGAGAAFAQFLGGTLSHSEHALRLSGPVPDVRSDPGTVLRPARDDDGPAVAALLAAVGWPPRDRTEPSTLVAEQDGVVVATLRAAVSAGEGAVHGFVVAPQLQGRGLGADLLARACRLMRARGADRIGLEVAVDNPRALGLYTRLGFTLVVTEDYYRLP